MSRAYRGAAGRIPASSGEICDRMNRRKETARKGGLLRRFCVCLRRKGRGSRLCDPFRIRPGEEAFAVTAWTVFRAVVFHGSLRQGRGRKRKYGASMRAPVGETRVVCTSGCRSRFFEPFNCFGPDSRSGSEPLFGEGTKGVRKASAPVFRRCMEGRMQSKKGKGKEPNVFG